MAGEPYRIVDRRSSSGYVNTNKLVEAATQTADRPNSPLLDYDIHRTISNLGRRTLVSLGRFMFWRFPALQGMVLEQANLAVSSFIPQYLGRNKKWGTLARKTLLEWYKVCDVAGWPYDNDTYLQNLVVCPIVEGEIFTLLTQTPDEYPLIQTIPTHRVGSRQAATLSAKVRYYQDKLWIDGVLVDEGRPGLAEDPIEFDAIVIDGVIVDAFSRPIAYRVYNDSFINAEYKDIPARNLFPAFTPVVPGQVRGFSLLASSVFDWQDMHQWKRWEMMAQMLFATRTIVESNEDGQADPTKQLIQTGATFDPTTNQKSSLDVQKMDGGTYTYLKSNTGSKIEPFQYDRPGPNTANFLKTTLRDAFRGTEWDMFFSLDPQSVGGAPMRVIVEKINSVLEKRRKLAKKCCLRRDGFALSKFMKLGLLPWDDDWYMWDYQGPGDVTADKKYDSDVALQETSQGISTRQLECARRGLHLEDVDEQRFQETDSDLERAGILAKKHNITIMQALVALRPPTQNQQLPTDTAPASSNQPPNANDGNPNSQ